jgi:hypothetical protein
MPRLAASAFIDSELAVRQALSAPVWAKPILSGAAAARVAAKPRMSARTLSQGESFMTQSG